MLLLLAVGAVQIIASLVFYAAIDRQSVREDHARRVAEFLIVSDRLHRLVPTDTVRVMTTGHLDAAIAATPSTPRSGTRAAVREIRGYVLAWEKPLADRPLFLDIHPGRLGHRDLVGSMQLADGKWLNFRSTDISSSWPIALRATTMTLLITLVCLGIGLLVLRRLTSPLTHLSEAADAITDGTAMAIEESGTRELRNLARTLNGLQAKINDMVMQQTRSFEAISHDLRTPLSRLIVASDFVSEDDIARIVASSAAEIEAMLASLQAFLRVQHFQAELEPVDLAAAVRDLLAGVDAPTTLSAPVSSTVPTFREPLLLSLRALIGNAVQYGSRADVTISRTPSDWLVLIEDDGPGIPEEYFGTILDPFFRLDAARARDTAGFGLGVPMAYRLLQRFGGRLEFANRETGGLRVTVTVPTTAEPLRGGSPPPLPAAL
ncbi:HAMP domain-containing sensor histidine kinase [Novosphingobium sp. H3SJ31-1]|uniref:histidine kinase n=2 Tax=Novosphingobium album (ex Liu et al. 2023) TaxID=3031130 RepID=A0ABT5WKP7_9SPHN|nr:HAMP domain-containing sensor histidine kinase [Novosphingobium album (ex Liu et al. 2023)]